MQQCTTGPNEQNYSESELKEMCGFALMYISMSLSLENSSPEEDSDTCSVGTVREFLIQFRISESVPEHGCEQSQLSLHLAQTFTL